ncbi:MULTISPECIES: ATP-dependent zinc protease [unclassified Halomonas]|uniref:retropepsin-like aspartic peptidase RloA3 n=1 Tax=unclassified Halomonas TaxID=2609666 RepID=UPI001CF17309|nr:MULTISPECIES: ATP-dependent zinc protease [unclassified Halomonas]MCA8866883.1 ATP-dependent zinc protease [Halomonas sp. SBBP1]UZH08552.1 ATP-dependent zinc protease [Halomonas sp. BDJS001]
MQLMGKIFVSSVVLGAFLSASTTMANDDQVFGWVEKATLQPWDIEVKAKLDSGALTSSLDARDIEMFEQDDEEWVRFRLKLEDQASGEVFSDQIERPLYRELSVRGAGGRDERPVVLLEVCMGDTIYEEQFSLRDREEMNYPLLLGRRTISHLGLLDVRETFLQEPECGENADVVPHDPADDQS